MFVLILTMVLFSQSWITLLDEDFENGVLPDGWTVVDMGDPASWKVGDFGNNVPPNSGSYWAYCRDYSFDPKDDRIYTPTISLINYSVSQARLSFDYAIDFISAFTDQYSCWMIAYKPNGTQQEVRLWNTYWLQTPATGSVQKDLTSYLPMDSVKFYWKHSGVANQIIFDNTCVDNVKFEIYGELGVVEFPKDPNFSHQKFPKDHKFPQLDLRMLDVTGRKLPEIKKGINFIILINKKGELKRVSKILNIQF